MFEETTSVGFRSNSTKTMKLIVDDRLEALTEALDHRNIAADAVISILPLAAAYVFQPSVPRLRVLHRGNQRLEPGPGVQAPGSGHRDLGDQAAPARQRSTQATTTANRMWPTKATHVSWVKPRKAGLPAIRCAMM